MYCKAGQTLEEEMFGNKDGSEAHEEFLNILGEKVKLQGFKGYKGDLDVNDNRTGTHSGMSFFAPLIRGGYLHAFLYSVYHIQRPRNHVPRLCIFAVER
jgi:hypothetical protein